MEKIRSIRDNKRIVWVDITKGIGIILVVFAHLDVGVIGTWIYTFHMPLFFFISGYVFNNTYDFKTFIKKKCKRILIPYFCLGIVMVAWQILWNYHEHCFSVHSSLVLIAELIIQVRFWTIWFIACLFFLNIIFYFISTKVVKEWVQFVIVVIMAVAVMLYYKLGGAPLYWNIDACFAAMPFFYVGFLLRKKKHVLDWFLTSRIKEWICMIVCLVINISASIAGYFISGETLEMNGSQYGCAPLTYISAFAGILMVVIVSHWINAKWVAYIGENSMLYFAWHQNIMIRVLHASLLAIGINYNAITNVLVLICERCAETAIILGALTLLNILISKSRLRFMIGK